MVPARSSYILTLQVADRVGIVAAISTFLAERDGFILDSQQYADIDSGKFFMRVEIKDQGDRFPSSLAKLRSAFEPLASSLALTWGIRDKCDRLKVMIAASKGGHCLNDLLHRCSTQDLPIDIVGVVSNHENQRALTEWHNVPFHYLPVTASNRSQQEARILRLMEESGAELLVLARYMQVLSMEMTQALEGRCINIHHSFLPAFKGAEPYHRAHARGVKLIGATAHFVTTDLDEGPIIEQAVEPVDHRATVNVMIRIGRHTEAAVLSKAVRAAAEQRIFLNGNKTVVFR